MRMYVDATINGHQTKALIDMGADVNYMSLAAARKIGLAWAPVSGHFKGVNGEWTSLVGEAKEVPVSIGNGQVRPPSLLPQ